MICGFTARMASSSRPSRERTPGRRLVAKMSAWATSWCSTSRACGLVRSSPMDRLPRLAYWKAKSMPSTVAVIPAVRSPRYGSPVNGCSTFTTSAPQSARTAVARGTKTKEATSTTRTPLRISYMSLLHSSSAMATGGSEPSGRLDARPRPPPWLLSRSTGSKSDAPPRTGSRPAAVAPRSPATT